MDEFVGFLLVCLVVGVVVAFASIALWIGIVSCAFYGLLIIAQDIYIWRQKRKGRDSNPEDR